ncbi:unnamed protein product [Oikopleura dioica]|uniref:Uncharacterized protein n=1 Tax=Oikopleura dioica TaxID=34765 RepID=E4Z5H7_OIKDI|nr:unnamed protein product [Oikopleura dioica]
MDQHSRYYFGRSSRLPGRESRCHHEIQF